MIKKVLVTGADGFIGSHLVEELIKEGYDVKAFVFYNSFNTWGWLDTLPPETLENLRREIDEASMVCNPQPEKHAGIGLPNIHMRIRLIYGAPYGLQISSSREGTCVCADFPVSPEASARAPVRGT